MKVARNYDCNVAQTVGSKIYDGYVDMLDSCDNENIKNMYNKYLDKVTIVSADEKRIKWVGYSTEKGGIRYNAKGNSKDTETRKKNSVFFHESGHNIDYLIGGKTGYSCQYENGLFSKTIKSEVDDWANNVVGRLEKEFENHKTDIGWLKEKSMLSLQGESMLTQYAKKYGGSLEDVLSGKIKTNAYYSKFLPSVNKASAYKEIGEEIKSLNTYEKQVISDILEGASNGGINCGWGHGKAYWNDETNLPTEAFAEMTESYVANHLVINGTTYDRDGNTDDYDNWYFGFTNGDTTYYIDNYTGNTGDAVYTKNGTIYTDTGYTAATVS